MRHAEIAPTQAPSRLPPSPPLSTHALIEIVRFKQRAAQQNRCVSNVQTAPNYRAWRT